MNAPTYPLAMPTRKLGTLRNLGNFAISNTAKTTTHKNKKAKGKEDKVLVQRFQPIQKSGSVCVFSNYKYLKSIILYPILGQGPWFEYWRVAALWAAWEYSHRRVKRHVNWWRADWRAGNSINLRIPRNGIQWIRHRKYASHWALFPAANIWKRNIIKDPQPSSKH